jgi:Fe-S-cluster containining protein
MSEIVKQVQELLKLPQELCNTCGKCCRIATFKGGLNYDQLLALSQSSPMDEDEAIQVDGAKDFLTIFEPYASTAEARKFAPEFVDQTLALFNKKDDEMAFFYCRYLGDDNLCKIHEDRPHLCRMYPIPHERTLFNPGCGFEEQAKKNWAEIKEILAQLDELTKPLNVGEKDGNH